MGRTLYLLETRAKNNCSCPACGRTIVKGSPHFRHDPHPYARTRRGEKITHWCVECIFAAVPEPKKELVTRRLRVPALQVLSRSLREDNSNGVEPLRVELVSIGQILSSKLAIDPALIHQVSASQFEELVCDRLSAMGLEPRRVGATNRKDGGVDVLFWPRQKGSFPFLGAAQIKHHRDLSHKEGPATVREFHGVMQAHPVNVGLVITNTKFTPDAEWFARMQAKLLRLRDFADLRRWLLDDFAEEAEWREVPKSLELCPGIVIDLR